MVNRDRARERASRELESVNGGSTISRKRPEAVGGVFAKTGRSRSAGEVEALKVKVARLEDASRLRLPDG